jgi:phage-related protein
MAETFTWYPDANHTLDVEPRVASAKFGDGYEQRVPKGINTTLDKWALTFTGTRIRVDAIAAFLKARGGAEWFTWKNPDEVTAGYICRKWSKQREGGAKVTITCEFEQVPA